MFDGSAPPAIDESLSLYLRDSTVKTALSKVHELGGSGTFYRSHPTGALEAI